MSVMTASHRELHGLEDNVHTRLRLEQLTCLEQFPAPPCL